MSNQNSSSPKKILIVEDDLFIREMYARVLKQHGYNVEEVNDGNKAVELILANDYDLVLLDVMLPQTSGMAVLMKVKVETTEKANTKVLMLTNLDQSLITEDCKALGAIDYLIKDQTTPEALISKLESVLQV